MNLLSRLSTAFILALSVTSCNAQIKNAKIETVKVYGNCDMCENNIEKAANKKHISKAEWNKNTKTAILTYDSSKTTSDAILKSIAYAGYDNQNYIAPDAAYNKLEQCCQYERKMKKEEAKQDTKTKTTRVMETANKTSITENINQLYAVYASYFELKNALVKDDGILAAEKAKELYKAINAVPMEKLTTEQHIVWMKYQKELSYHAERIKDTEELEQQREIFMSLSKNMFEVMKVIKNEAMVYYDFCPMANSGKGAYWVSEESKIANPYFGKQMLTCGSVKETVNPTK